MSVESRRFPYVPLTIQIRGRTLMIEALLDTGFDGGVVVPYDLLGDGLLPDTDSRWELPDGLTVLAPAFSALVQIGQMHVVSTTVVCLGDEVLVGRRVTDRFRLILDHGVRVIVEP